MLDSVLYSTTTLRDNGKPTALHADTQTHLQYKKVQSNRSGRNNYSNFQPLSHPREARNSRLGQVKPRDRIIGSPTAMILMMQLERAFGFRRARNR